MRVTSLTTKSGKKMEFVDGLEPESPKLIMASFGPWGSGKSRFGITAPEIVGLVPTDRKSRRTWEKTLQQMSAEGNKKRILMPKQDFIRQQNPLAMATMDEAKSIEYYRRHVDQIKDACYIMHDHKDVQTIVIDTANQLYQDICYANYGREFITKKIGDKPFKDKSDANQEFIDLINALSSKHLILTNKDRDEYQNKKATGRTTWDGFKGLGFHCNLTVEHTLNSAWTPDAEGEWQFGLSIRHSQERTDLCNAENILVDEGITFGNLATILYPEHDWI